MFDRLALKALEKWSLSTGRKPLVIRGARQVGKTSLVKEFAKKFPHFIHLNLDFDEHRKIFENDLSFEELIDAIFFLSKMPKEIKSTILFIDEIQNSGKAIQLLRYFYEKAPDLHVIAAGSLLETTLNRKISFPVGRVEYLFLTPVSFLEFLSAMNEKEMLDMVYQRNVPVYAHDSINKLFFRYALVGGMPEIVQRLSETNDLANLQSIYQSLILSYKDDVEKYAPNANSVNYIRHILTTGFFFAGQRIKLEGFGSSNYRSREIGESFQLLEKTMLLRLVYPLTQTQPPFSPNRRKLPRLQWFDIGLVNFMANIQTEVFMAKNFSDSWRGLTAEIIVGQELKAYWKNLLIEPAFWVREEKNATSEIDFVLPYNNTLIPIEVKSGKTGKLKSLHIFMDLVPHHTAIRVWANPFSIEEAITPTGKKFKLINLPFYLLSQWEYFVGANN